MTVREVNPGAQSALGRRRRLALQSGRVRVAFLVFLAAAAGAGIVTADGAQRVVRRGLGVMIVVMIVLAVRAVDVAARVGDGFISAHACAPDNEGNPAGGVGGAGSGGARVAGCIAPRKKDAAPALQVP